MNHNLSRTASILLFLLAVAPLSSLAAEVPDLAMLPANATPGECYTRVWLPASYRTVSEQVLVKDASENLKVVPAKYEWGEERVVVKEASERLEVIPANYTWVEEKILVKPESTRIEQIPAVYDTVTERVMDQPAHTVWKEGRGPIEKVNNSTGEIMCLVEVPASYKTVTKKQLKSPATTREVTIPAEYKTVKRQVMSTPPTTRKIEIPAEYKTEKVRREVEPARVNRSPVPAEYRTVTRTEKVTEGHMEWMSVLCETNASPDLITSLQRSLKKAGHDPGPIDGVIGAQTLTAVSSFQRANGLPQGGITMAALDRLGVQPK